MEGRGEVKEGDDALKRVANPRSVGDKILAKNIESVMIWYLRLKQLKMLKL